MKHAVLLLLLVAATASGQQPAAALPEVQALRACTALADSGKVDAAQNQGKSAATLYRKRLARDPRDIEAMVGAARALSQCLVPSAEFMEQGELSKIGRASCRERV